MDESRMVRLCSVGHVSLRILVDSFSRLIVAYRYPAT